MSRPKLHAEKRNIFGKKVKKLRREKILPANLYGKDFTSCAVKIKSEDFQKVFSQTGETGLVDLQIKEKEVYPALIHNVSFDPLTEEILHVDFYKVNLSEKVSATVPIVLSGEPEAVKKGEGLLLTLLDEIEVEGLPDRLPAKITINVSHLSKVDDAILVKELELPNGIRALADFDELICKIEEPEMKEEKTEGTEVREEEESEKTEGKEKEGRAGEKEAEEKGES